MRAVIDKYAALPFRYGQDCCSFVGECIESITGSNPIAHLNYQDRPSAYAIIDRYGDLEGAMRHYLGEPYDGHKDGDACLIDNNGGELAAAVIYKGRVVARVKGGLCDYPLERALMVWCT
jgi:hypothetical protein